MVYCVAFGCNNRSGQNKSFFSILGRKKEKKWIRNISNHRAKWTPSKHSALCQDHFTEEQFLVSPVLASNIGYTPSSLRLKEDATPTLFAKRGSSLKPNVVQKRKSIAYQKRQNAELLKVTDSNIATKRHKPTSTTSTLTKDVEEEIYLPFMQTSLEYQGHDVYESQLDLQLEEVISSTTNHITLTQITAGSQNARPMKSRSTQTTKTVCKTSSAQSYVCTTKNSWTQTSLQFVENKEVQCTLLPEPENKMTDTALPILTESLNESFEPEDDRDPDYDPLFDSFMSSFSENEYDMEDNEVACNITLEEHPATEKKFLVYESCLYLLLSACFLCSRPCTIFIESRMGSKITFLIICAKGHIRKWTNQPVYGSKPAGNIDIALALLSAGCSSVKALRFLTHLNMFSISLRTYNNIQRFYLNPAINNVWESFQSATFVKMRMDFMAVNVGGDGRCDSPGHSAKYCSYTLMDLDKNLILDTQLIQYNETGSSQTMEFEGLKRSLDRLLHEGIFIGTLITDRHPSVKKYMRHFWPGITHYFDVWHVAKNVHKKLVVLGRKRGHEIIARWAKSISNHLYWCAASSNGVEQEVKSKWLSVANHVINKHEHQDVYFSKCEHEDNLEREWIKPGSRQHKALLDVIESNYLLRDIGKLSPNQQTCCLESFHKVVCYFAPKTVHFFYPSMKVRVLLAALHFNENGNRDQRKNKAGELVYVTSYPKHLRGDGVFKQVKTDLTFDYVKTIQEEVKQLLVTYKSYAQAASNINESLNPVTITQSMKNKVPRQELQSRFRSRFNVL